MDNVVIIGAGGVGKETALLIEQINKALPTWNLLGFLDDNAELHNTYINGHKVLGGVDYIDKFYNIYVVCAIAGYKARKRVVARIDRSRARFVNIIHPSVYISTTNSLGEGCIIYPGVILSTNIRIGNHVIISPKCGIGHETVIGDYCSLLWNVNVSGNVVLGEGVMMGSGSTIIQGKSIGAGSIVGAGGTVIDDLPENCTVAGVPARPINSVVEGSNP